MSCSGVDGDHDAKLGLPGTRPSQRFLIQRADVGAVEFNFAGIRLKKS